MRHANSRESNCGSRAAAQLDLEGGAEQRSSAQSAWDGSRPTGKADEAESLLIRAARIDPVFAAVHMNLAFLYLIKNAPEKQFWN